MGSVCVDKISRDEVKPGDHIYTWRASFAYTHHGIYVGDGKVIHFTRRGGLEAGTGTFLDRFIVSSVPRHRRDNPCPDCKDQSNLGGVISSCLDCFLAGKDLYLFKYDVSPAFFLAIKRGGTCTTATSDPPEQVISRANFLFSRNGFGVYDLLENNCEDFAIYCKTSLLGRSGQANTVSTVACVAHMLSYTFKGLSWASDATRLFSDIGMRIDVTKVPVETVVLRSNQADTSTRED